eukprot:m.978497 g.978497  ORF g.978497 m.978497 type:complete len:50 (+) comp23959_c0_seq1:1669-1818(+)
MQAQTQEITHAMFDACGCAAMWHFVSLMHPHTSLRSNTIQYYSNQRLIG